MGLTAKILIFLKINTICNFLQLLLKIVSQFFSRAIVSEVSTELITTSRLQIM